jgi:hypothetical protein
MNPRDKSRPLKHARILAHDAINEHAAKSDQHAKNKNSNESVASERNQNAEGPDGLQNVKTESHFSLSCCHQPFPFFRSIHSTARPDIGGYHALLYPGRRECARNWRTESFYSPTVAGTAILERLSAWKRAANVRYQDDRTSLVGRTAPLKVTLLGLP